MTFLLAATFKSHKTFSEVVSWLESVMPAAAHSAAEVLVAPSFTCLAAAQAQLQAGSSGIALTAQDVSPFPPGSYTGAVNARELQDLGVRYCLIGHSERRRYFHETHAEIANKASELLGLGITPVLCLSGEDIISQIAALKSEHIPGIVYCYEPPADIGGTVTAPVEEITKALAEIKDAAVIPVRVMYGGSVNAGNLKTLLDLKLDGVLVSTASLDPAAFTEIIQVYGESENR